MRGVPGVILLAMLALASAGAAADEKLPYVIGEWPPYTSESLDGYGFMAKIAAAVARELSMTQMSFMISRTYPGAAQLREKVRQAWHRIKNRDDVRALFQQHAPGSEVSDVGSPLRNSAEQ